LDLVVCSPGPSLPGNTVSRDVVPAPGSLGTVDPGVIKVGLPGYLGTSSPHVNWRQVENSVEQACSRVVAVDKLLWEAMVMVDWDILHLIWVS
jgi:hypothetical protein